MKKLKHNVLVLVCAGQVGSSLLVAAAAQAQDVSFVGARLEYYAGIEPGSIVVGDFNSDGVEDLAVVSRGSRYLTIYPGSVRVLLGNGDGTFRQAGSYDVGIQPGSIALGDFNGDGLLDLVTANSYGTPYGVSVLLGNGDGTFRARDLGYGTAPSSVAVGDFNGDGIQDLALANRNNIALLFGNGDGTFQEAQTFGSGTSPTWVVADDFNRDGALDLAVAAWTSGDVSVFLGNGDGTFQDALVFHAAASARLMAMAMGDFNGDGVEDLVVVNRGPEPLYDDGSVVVFLGNGDGSFQEGRSFLTGPNPQRIAVGDFNADGAQDLALANGDFVSVSVFLGNGDGTFQSGPRVAVGEGAGVSVGDFNGDGALDLATVNGFSDTFSVVLGKGDGTFVEPPSFRAGNTAVAAAAADFNGDGALDLAVANARSNDLSVLLGNGDGTFQEPRNFGAGSVPSSVAVGDFNGDGVKDVVVANAGTDPQYVDGSVSVLLGNGDGTFQPARNLDVGGSARGISVGDFNGDGFDDLVVADYPSNV